jgi:hypothetical protein
MLKYRWHKEESFPMSVFVTLGFVAVIAFFVIAFFKDDEPGYLIVAGVIALVGVVTLVIWLMQPSGDEPSKIAAASEAVSEWTLSSFLSWVISYVLYPALIVGFLLIVSAVLLENVLEKGASTETHFRRATAALLPIFAMVILVVAQPNDEAVKHTLASISPAWLFVHSLWIAIVMTELDRWISGYEIVTALYCMTISAMGAFVVWAIVSGVSSYLQMGMLGGIVGVSLHIVFRSPPPNVVESTPSKEN